MSELVPRPPTCHICAAIDCDMLRDHPHDTCPIYIRLRDALLPTKDDIEAKAAHALFWLVRELGKLERRERVRLTGELVALFSFARAIATRTTRSTVTQAIDAAWRLRCEGSDPWPDSDADVPDDPHDGTAKHVFDLLRAAAEAEPEPEQQAH